MTTAQFLELAKTPDVYKPVRLTAPQLAELRASSVFIVRDEYESIIEELCKIDNPSVIRLAGQAYAAALDEYRQQYLRATPIDGHGVWMYYPWQHCIVHIPDSDVYYRLKSARNRNLIAEDEQQKLASVRVGVAGLSVGSSAVSALAHMGVRHFSLADADTLAISNLNRLRGGLPNLGLEKTIVAARGIYELDPYSSLKLYSEGLSTANLTDFTDSLDVLVDEMDDIVMKVQLRLIAKQRKLPVVMATDNGDNVLIDIERYDQNPDLPIFHGLLTTEEVETILEGNISQEDFMHYAMKIIDVKHAPVRLLQSIPLIGAKLAGIPQLGTAAMLAGATIAYVIREITNNAPLKHGKHHVNLEGLLRADYQALEVKQKDILRGMMR